MVVYPPRTETELQDVFVDYGPATGPAPTGTQAQMLLALFALYARKGMLRAGRPAPLCEICPRREPCWNAAPVEWRRSDGEDGGLCLPWVGAEYGPGGVVVLAINPHIGPSHETALLIEYEITHGQYIPSFQRGAKGIDGSRFAYGSMRTAAGLHDHLTRRPVLDRGARATRRRAREGRAPADDQVRPSARP